MTEPSTMPLAARRLQDAGVRVVFGYPSVGADALLEHLAASDHVKVVVASSESDAAAAAHAYAALSCRPCAVVVDPTWAAPELTRHVHMAAAECLPVVYVLPAGNLTGTGPPDSSDDPGAEALPDQQAFPEPIDGPVVWASETAARAVMGLGLALPGPSLSIDGAQRVRAALAEGTPLVLLPSPTAPSRPAAERVARRWQLPCLTTSGTDPFAAGDPDLWLGRTGFVPSRSVWDLVGPEAENPPLVVDLGSRDRPEWIGGVVGMSPAALDALLSGGNREAPRRDGLLSGNAAAGGPSPVDDPLGAALRALAEALPNAVVIADAGHSHRAVAEQVANRGRTAVLTSGLTPMGWSVGATLGAAEARPGDPLITVMGDGSALGSVGHWAAFATRRVPVVVLLAVNGRLGERRGGAMAGRNRLPDVAWDRIAAAVGLVAEPAPSGQLRPAALARIVALVSQGSPVLVTVDTTATAGVPQSPTGIAAVDDRGAAARLRP